MERDQLRAAVEADIISADQAARLEAMFRGHEEKTSEGEPLRFLSNLNDVFLSIGIIILFFGLGAAFSIIGFGKVSFSQYAPIVTIPLALSAWGMAEYFCARRRMLLPSIVLASLWSICVGLLVFFLLAWNIVEQEGGRLAASVIFDNGDTGDVIRSIADESHITAILGIVGGAIGALVFYFRFRLPFTHFLMMAALAMVALTIMPGFGTLLLTGIASLMLAIWFDSRDPDRATRLSDNGFWLHVAAAPQIVYGLRGVLGESSQLGGLSIHLVLVIVLAGLALLSLVLNRRALIISALLTFGWSIWNLFQMLGDSFFLRFAGPLLLVGAIVVVIGSGWKTVRRFLLAGFPKTGAFARIFPPEH